MIIGGYLHGSVIMRTEADIKATLDELKITQRRALESRLLWTLSDTEQRIRSLEWVLGIRDEL